jgi:hypothetical protein
MASKIISYGRSKQIFVSKTQDLMIGIGHGSAAECGNFNRLGGTDGSETLAQRRPARDPGPRYEIV